jgi:hypothetical protein
MLPGRDLGLLASLAGRAAFASQLLSCNCWFVVAVGLGHPSALR